MPRATLGAELLHQGLFEMAAAFFSHLGRNHPFVDGNKHMALAPCLAFPWLNDQEPEISEEGLTQLAPACRPVG